MDNRGTNFRDWLISSAGYHYLCCARAMKPEHAVNLLASYLDHMARTPWNKAGDLRTTDTLHKHVNAAATFLTRVMDTPFLLQRNTSGKIVTEPLIAQRFAFISKWDKVRPKREPYTQEMFRTFRDQVAKLESKHPKEAFLSLHSLVYDTQILGIFTGSRVSEYAQPKGPRSLVSRVPSRPGISNANPQAIAFIASDFEFLSASGRSVAHSDLFRSPELAHQLNITFRHDKSGRSYTVRKYGKGSNWMCPIKAAIRLLHRAHMLRIPPHDPICAYRRPGSKGHIWLKGEEVTACMRKICLCTYKDPQHFLHKNVKRFSSHSNRVTAAVALSQTGMTIDDIAQRLRWKPESVAFYLRESATDVGNFTAKTVAGAQRAFVSVDYAKLNQTHV
jgi:hypothetical protein